MKTFGSKSYQDAEDKLKCGLDSLGQFVLKRMYEGSDRHFRENLQERPGWVIVRRGDVKEVLTPLGPVRYERTYFRNKFTGEYRYLADDYVGFTQHIRMIPSLRAMLVESAVDMSYRQSGKWTMNEVWQVSGQTVMKAVREAPSSQDERSRPEKQRAVKYSYIEADEDHIPNQDPKGARWQPRLVYVHDGVEGKGERRFRERRRSELDSSAC